MRVIPEINIMNGHCVKRGTKDYMYSEIISHSPREIAKMWEEQGASWLHIRDFDGVMAGHIMNHEVIKKLINHVSIPVEIYGGIYSLKEMENVLNLGAERVVLELEHMNMKMIQDAVNNFGADRIVMHMEGRSKTNAFRTTLHPAQKFGIAELLEILKRIASLGIHTVECDGVFQDTYSFVSNAEQMKNFWDAAGIHIVLSGGVFTIKELEYLESSGAYGVILDDVLYERRIELKQAIGLFEKGAYANEL